MISDELAFGHPEHPVRTYRKFIVMRHDHEGYTLLFVDPEEEVMDRLAGMHIEISGRFVGKHDIRFQHQRPGDGNALLFSARELSGPVMKPRSEPYIGQHSPGSIGCFFPVHPPDESRHHDVFER